MTLLQGVPTIHCRSCEKDKSIHLFPPSARAAKYPTCMECKKEARLRYYIKGKQSKDTKWLFTAIY